MKKPKILSLYTLGREKKYSQIRAIVVKIDETQYWSEDIQKKANGKIFGIYLIDLTSPTHLCSIEVNYPAYLLYNHFENVSAWQDENGEWLNDGEGSDEITELERVNLEDEVKYYTEHSTFEIISEVKYTNKEFNALLKNIDDNKENATNQWIENLTEYYRSNVPI